MLVTNIGAERSVIGNILLDAEKVMPEAALVLTKESFADPICSSVFGVCMELYEAQEPIDPVVVIGKAGGTENSAYRKACLDMAAETPTVRNYRTYIQLVKQAAQIRAAQEKTEAFHQALLESTDTEALRSQAAEIVSCFDDTTAQDAVSAREGYVRFYQALEQKKEYIATGFRWLDKRIYFDKGKYMIVGGRPSSGKTALTLQMALHMARDHNVVYFSLETSTENVFERLAACYTGTSFSAIKQRNVKYDVLADLCNRTNAFSALHLNVVQAAGWNVAQLRSKAIQLKADIIFIDYLTLIQSRERSQYEKATQISIDLHTMAQQLKIGIVALAQLNRAGNEVPSMANIRESGQIEQDADVILLLHQPKEDDPARSISVAKCKDGVVGCHSFSFDGERQRFFDREERWN